MTTAKKDLEKRLKSIEDDLASERKEHTTMMAALKSSMEAALKKEMDGKSMAEVIV